MVLDAGAVREEHVRQCGARGAYEQDRAPAMAVGQPSPNRGEDELHRGVSGKDDADNNAVGAEVLAVGRNEGHDNAEPDEVNEDREEDDENGRLSHAGKANKARAVRG